MKSILLIIICLLSFFNLSAQYQPTQLSELEENYIDYFKLNREIVFLHLNKTTMIEKENLWISAYVYNMALNSPNIETVNLDLNVFNESGKFLESKTVLITGGKGSVFIDLNNEIYSEGKYYIRASTKYMGNFKEDLSYLQTFEILGNSTLEEGEKEQVFDLHLLPEGGHILADVNNTIGVKLNDSNGNPVIFSKGKLMDSKSNIIGEFKSNQLGLAKFNFLAEANQSYNVEVTTYNGETVKGILPKAALKGFSFSGNNLKDQFIFGIKTNKNSYDLVRDKKFHAAIHKDGNIKDFTFQFPKDAIDVSFKLGKDSLFSGVNTITIFDENFNPLLERLFFNDKNNKRIRVSAKTMGTPSDSITINLKSLEAIENNSLSISVLPATTKAYGSNHNILSAFYLKPYIKGDLINANYYFSDEDPRKIKYDLDLLLLTQGWSKFEWNAIYNNTPEELFPSERGFTISGNIQGRNEKKENTLFIKSEETGLFEIVNIENDNSFILENIYILDNSKLSYGIMNDKNSKISKPLIYANVLPNKSQSSLKLQNSFKKYKVQDDNKINIENFILDAESLDTVMLTGENKKADKYLNDLRVIKPEVTITEEIENRYQYITDYIAANGFRVLQGGYGSLVIENRTPSSISRDATPIPQIFFNGMRLGTDTSPLVYLKTSEVESIIISTSGIGYGMNGNNGVIEIKTRKGRSSTSSRETIKEIITTNGFSANQEFYAPKYTSYSGDAFKNYGVISWVSDLSLGENGIGSFKVLNTMQKEISVFIEGMASNGSLISEIIKLKTQ